MAKKALTTGHGRAQGKDKIKAAISAFKKLLIFGLFCFNQIIFL
jgi:hypothetical protein